MKVELLLKVIQIQLYLFRFNYSTSFPNFQIAL